jgi:hypothetical protein
MSVRIDAFVMGSNNVLGRIRCYGEGEDGLYRSVPRLTVAVD